MIIGVDGSRAFLKQRTGIEEYSYQAIKNLRNKLGENQVILYVRKNQEIDFELPKNWKVKKIKMLRFWTQIGLSAELFFHPVDVLFVPAHILPLYHPKKSIVTIHGLEFEICQDAYSLWGRMYMHLSIKKSCFWANKVIAVSKNTKKDLMEIYKVPEKKIEVIYEGANQKSKITRLPARQENQNDNLKFKIKKPYLLFVGRLEKRKNIEGIISAFEILKDKYKISYKLILAGNSGFGYGDIKNKIENSCYKNDIIETGFINEEEKFEIIKNAEIFLFPTFYEGFGLPILEAQSQGVPVVTSNVSSLPEVGGDSVAYATPEEPISISDSTWKILSDENFRKDLIRKGYKNLNKFSWEKCAEEIAKLLLK